MGHLRLALQTTRLLWTDERRLVPREFKNVSAGGAICGIALFIVGDIRWEYAASVTVCIPIAWFIYVVAGACATLEKLAPPRLSTTDTARLRVRPMRLSDAQDYEESLDSFMIEMNGWTETLREQSIERARSTFDHDRRGSLVATLSTTGQPVAFANVYWLESRQSWSIGFWATPASRGERFASEAFAGVLQCIHDAGIPVLEVGTSSENVAMLAVFRSAGCTFLESQPHELPDGSLVQSEWYSHHG